MTIILTSTAEAKRFGGGSSFGSKKSYSSPFKKSAQKKSFSQQKAAATNQQRKQQLSNKGGLMGMLGGLALGGLLGALLFGGAFENFNMFDFLIIGGIIFAVIWFMKRKALNIAQAQTASPDSFNTVIDTKDQNIQSAHEAQNKVQTQFKANNNTDIDNTANSKDKSFAESFGMHNDHTSSQDSTTQKSQESEYENEFILPEWFDQEEFIKGARAAYTLLQKAWDKADLESIRSLTTDAVYNEISRQLTAQESSEKTRIMQLNAELIDFNEHEEHSEASVLFDVLMDEGSDNTSGRVEQVRELWHFVRSNNSSEPTWFLDGLQQLD